MKKRKLVYSSIALSKRKAIKKDIKSKYGKIIADRFSNNVTKRLQYLKTFPESGVSMREQYDLDCDYSMVYIEHNYFIYYYTDEVILVLEIFNEREDFMYQMFGIVTTSQDTIDFWGED